MWSLAYWWWLKGRGRVHCVDSWPGGEESWPMRHLGMVCR